MLNLFNFVKYALKPANYFRLRSNTSPNSKMWDNEINRMVWLDMEMTGLNIEQDKILEVACIVTDSNLNIVAEGPSLIIHQPSEILYNMNAWCTKQHQKSGLTEASKNSNISVTEAENTILDFVMKYTTEKCSPLAGNSVYMDRIFLKKFMPKVDSYLHYRIIDVSTVKELCRRWDPEIYRTIPKKEFSHRALDDIKESIKELQFYKNAFFKLNKCVVYFLVLFLKHHIYAT